jgi:hypothetical protein
MIRPPRLFARLRRATALLAVVVALSLAPVPPGAAALPDTPRAPAAAAGDAADPAAAGRARLSFSPRAFVGGQAMTFRGSLGVGGKRRIVLQQHMNRPGDSWVRVPGYRGTTERDGTFALEAQAPSMFGISYRVFAPGYPTPGVTLDAKSQDLTVWVAGPDRTDEERPGVPVAGRPFTVSVDTTPADLYRRPDTKGLPVFTGRRLTLQKRLPGARWSTLATTRVRPDGMGYFTGVRAPAGTTVYRVRQEAWTKGGSRIGWMPSFPTYVRVATDRRQAQRLVQQQPPRLGRVAARPGASTAGGSAEPTASQRYRWSPSLFDFAWERGESLSSRPYRGSSRRGSWTDHVGGTGRVSQHNGGLSLESKRHNGPGRGDVGTTWATMRGNARTYGRWETRLRLKTSEDNARDYRVRVELVPERARDQDCGRHDILVAQIRAHGRRVDFGVAAGRQRWTGSRRVGSFEDTAHALAVEVQRRHITWFVDGTPVGTVKSRRAVPGVPMTLRLSMVGDGRREMNQTQVMSDWQRGFPAGAGRQVRSGAPLKRSALPGGCSG